MRLTSYRLTFFSLLLVLATNALGQAKKVSDNKKPEFSTNYFPKENSEDTTYVVLDFERDRLEIRKDKENAGNYNFDRIRFTMAYNNPLSPNEIVYFIHIAGPPFGNEVYSVNKSSLSRDRIIFEPEKNAVFWYHNYLRLKETIVILIDLKDWENKKDWVKGLGVQVSINTIE